jgi:two-component system sensor histidine kinase AtoS
MDSADTGHAPPRRPAFRSLRARLLALLFGGVIVPLAVLAWWTTRASVRSGRALLQSQLDSALAQSVAEFESHWRARRADLLLLVENEPTRRMLRDSTPNAASTPDPFVTRAFAQTSDIDHVVLLDARGRLRWSLGAADAPDRGVGYLREPFVVTRLPVSDVTTGETIGSVEARVRAASLLPGIATAASHDGPVTAIRTPDGDLVAPSAADDGVFLRGVDRAGRRWLVVRRAIALPALEISIAGALDPVLAPFEHTANAALAALAVAAGVVTCIVLVAGRRMTAGLQDAVVAAEAVAAGDLDRRLPVRSNDEVGRLAASFNSMTESLRSTMDELSRKEALAAVGEFASELAHEIRNPLTAIRLDLQRVEEGARNPELVEASVPRIVRLVDRLDRAVTGALRVARGRRDAASGEVDVAGIVELAAQSARPEFDRRGATLSIDATPLPSILADATALEQVFVNLLVNAAHASRSGGTTRVSITGNDGRIAVAVIDDGVGMDDAQLSRISRPFNSSKRDGTGLGLKVARRLVEAHRGTLTLESAPGRGTRVTVELPRSTT